MSGEARRALSALIVDDVASNRWVLGRLLNQLGVQWTEVAGGREALRALCRRSFDVVFMDVEMPSMDGPATTRQLRHMERQSARHLPVVAFTSLESQEVRQRCFDAGMDAFMTKPVSLPLLRVVIDQLTGQARGDHPPPEQFARRRWQASGWSHPRPSQPQRDRTQSDRR